MPNLKRKFHQFMLWKKKKRKDVQKNNNDKKDNHVTEYQRKAKYNDTGN